MLSLSSLRLGPRLSLGFAAIVVLFACAVAYGVDRIQTLQALATRLGTLDAERLSATERWARAIEANASRGWVMFFSADPAIQARLKTEMDEVVAAHTIRLKRLQEIAATEADKRLLEAISKQRDSYQSLRKDLLARQAAGEDVRELVFKQLFPAAQAYQAVVEKLVANQRDTMIATRSQAEAAAYAGTVALAVGGVLAMLLAGLLAWRLTRSIVAPINQAKAVAEAIAAGDLTQRIAITGRDQAADLLRALQAMQTSLRATVGQVRSSSHSIHNASAEIATGNLDLSTRTELTASNLQQASSSMQQLSGAVKQSADAAHQASQFAGAAADVAQRGGSVVSQVVATMSEINDSSKKIADIIGVIDGIAFQTNILALNAAVEAARAGEQGRGFAVVASEVRSLAQRSAAAAKEIKTLIVASVDKVESGTRLVASAGQTMGEIVASVQRVSDMIGEVTAAAAEQASGIAQVSDAVAQLDQMTQQNAALVEQAAAAAESLKDQASGLTQSVASFKLDAALVS